MAAAASDAPAGAAPLPPSVPISQPSKAPTYSAVLTSTPSNLDAFLVHLHRCMRTPAGIDTVLMFLGYTSRLTSNILDSASRTALAHSAQRLIALAFALPPKTAILLSSAPQASPLAALAIKLSASLRALSGLIAEGRMFTRSYALIGLYFRARGLATQIRQSSSSTEKKPAEASAESLDRTIAAVQLTALFFFHALENASLLGAKGIISLSPAQRGKATRWSVRSWALFVGVELGRLLMERQRKMSGKGAVTSAEHRAWKEGWQRSFVRNMAWAPLTVHWSFGDGFISDTGVWALACVPAVIQMRQLWRENA